MECVVNTSRAVGHRLRRRADGFVEHLDEQRMISMTA
jgi:hypothetical protein